jgi:hypothetical protein
MTGPVPFWGAGFLFFYQGHKLLRPLGLNKKETGMRPVSFDMLVKQVADM